MTRTNALTVLRQRPPGSALYEHPVLVRVGPEHPEAIYKTWINAQQPDLYGLHALGDLAIQPRLVVHLYGDGCQRVCSLRVSNPHQPFFRQVLNTIRERPAWDMAAFDAAREHIYQQYHSVFDLWKGLQVCPLPN